MDVTQRISYARRRHTRKTWEQLRHLFPKPHNWRYYSFFIHQMGYAPDDTAKVENAGSIDARWVSQKPVEPEVDPAYVPLNTKFPVQLTAFKGYTKHELSGVWLNMLDRCYNENSKAHAKYKDRKPEERWHSFTNFLNDMGPRPTPEHTLERVDNNKGYSKDNCVWATVLAQQNNKETNVKVRFEGVDYTISTLAKKVGMNYAKLRHRLMRGWPVEEAVKPEASEARKLDTLKAGREAALAQRGRFVEHNGETMCLKDWCKKLNLNYGTVITNIHRGMAPKRALKLL